MREKLEDNQQETLNNISKILRRHLGAEYRIFLFGSRATGNAKNRSDFDVGIQGPKAVPFSVMAKIEEDMEDVRTLAKIDVVDFYETSDAFSRMALERTKTLK